MCGKVDMFRNAFDISQAFPQTKLKPEEMIILEYPQGMDELFDNGQKKYILLVMNLYACIWQPRSKSVLLPSTRQMDYGTFQQQKDHARMDSETNAI